MSDRDPDLDFEPISPNPYIVGNPVRDPAMFFGRESEFELIQRRFQAAPHGGLIVFCGERRSGKTSILFQILQGRLGESFVPVLIDMQSMAVDNEIDFLGRIAAEIIEAVGPEARVDPPDFSVSSKPSVGFHRFVENLIRRFPSRRLILLFDEYELFENKIESGVLTEDVLNILSSLMESRCVFLVFTGSQHLEQRKHSYWKILPKSIYRPISFLQPEDTRRLIRRPVEGRVTYDAGVVDAILRLTSGQPFYVQAICQSLVDSLNEKRTCTVTAEILLDVVQSIVENAFPQMIFLWDGLEPDERLVLALAAEVLTGEDHYVTAEDLFARERVARYHLDLTPARVCSALEALFKRELLKKDSKQPPGYAFRMDLWRFWIRRMHSVWQVMRELGIEVHRGSAKGGRPSRTVVGLALAGLAVILVGGGLMVAFLVRQPARSHPNAQVTADAGMASYWLMVAPVQAGIFREGVAVGTGEYRDTVPVGQDIRFRIVATGYRDTTCIVRATSGLPLSNRITLRPLRGDLEIRTDPSGASVWVDGVPRGPSPVIARGLEVTSAHAVRVMAEGRTEETRSVTIRADTLTSLHLALSHLVASVEITTFPTGAGILVDSQLRGASPVRIADLALGRHSIRATADGYRPRDTTLVIPSGHTRVDLVLVEEPPGILEIQGDVPVRMYVNDRLVAENLPNSGSLQLHPGMQALRIVFLSGQAETVSVQVAPAEHVVYDFTRRLVTGRHAVGDRKP